jgi:hypothetical protein
MRLQPSTTVDTSPADLRALVPVGIPQQGGHGQVTFVIRNTGTAVGYVCAEADEPSSALDIPVARTRTVTLSWPASRAWLVFGAGGEFVVTPVLGGRP